jgi:hypothetical protein
MSEFRKRVLKGESNKTFIPNRGPGYIEDGKIKWKHCNNLTDKG